MTPDAATIARHDMHRRSKIFVQRYASALLAAADRHPDPAVRAEAGEILESTHNTLSAFVDKRLCCDSSVIYPDWMPANERREFQAAEAETAAALPEQWAFTPGPWGFEKVGREDMRNVSHLLRSHARTCDDGEGNQVPMPLAEFAMSGVNNEANVRLASLAPHLLEAVYLLSELFCGFDVDPPAGTGPWEIYLGTLVYAATGVPMG